MTIDEVKRAVRKAAEQKAIDDAYAATVNRFDHALHVTFADWLVVLDRELGKSLTFYCEAR